MNIRSKAPKVTNARDANKPALTPVKADKPRRSFKGVIGFFMLVVVASIVFSTYMVYAGTGAATAPKIMIVPQAIFAAVVLIARFTASARHN